MYEGNTMSLSEKILESNFKNNGMCFLALDCSGPFIADHSYRLAEMRKMLASMDTFGFYLILFGDFVLFSKMFINKNVDELSGVQILTPEKRPKNLDFLFDHILDAAKELKLVDPPRTFIVTDEKVKDLPSNIDETKFRLNWFIV